MALEEEKLLEFGYDKTNDESPIKVIGVGGGGGNAVLNMVREGVPGVSFLLCNTDRQDLENAPSVKDRILLGYEITKGQGAGDNPQVAQQAALASEPEIRRALDDGVTSMVFITAGMGGGTGTGAAPVIGRIAREMGLLTVGIVTIPYLWEGKKKIVKALKAVEEMRKNVDAILVINNERLRIVYTDYTFSNSLEKADETLTNAARGISEMIHRDLKFNVDMADVKTTLKDGGVAIISTGYGEGENRLEDALNEAVSSPLLNDNDISKARRLLLCIFQNPAHPITNKETEALNRFTGKIVGDFQTIPGFGDDETLGEKVKVSILASGFDIEATRSSIDPTTAEMMSAEAKREESLISKYYTKEVIDHSNSLQVFRPVILSDDELDDDELLTAVEDMPALYRNYSIISDIRSRRERSQLASSPLKNIDGSNDFSFSTSEDKKKESSTHSEERNNNTDIIRFHF